MNRTRIRTLAVLAGLLGAGDWFLASLPADDPPPGKPALTVGNAAVSAALRGTDDDGKKAKHLFLDLAGEGAGTLKVRLAGTPFQPMSRMLPRPRTLWEKDIAADTGRSKSIDLGPLPDGLGDVLFTLSASAGGKAFAVLLEIPPPPARPEGAQAPSQPRPDPTGDGRSTLP